MQTAHPRVWYVCLIPDGIPEYAAALFRGVPGSHPSPLQGNVFACTRQIGQIGVVASHIRQVLPGVTRYATACNRFETSITSSLIQIVLQFTAAAGMTEFAGALGLNWTDTLTGYVKYFTHFFQCSRSSVIKTETQTQHFLLPLCSIPRTSTSCSFKSVKAAASAGTGTVILNKISQMGVFLLTDRRLERYRLLRNLQDLADPLYRHTHFLRDLFRLRFSSKS